MVIYLWVTGLLTVTYAVPVITDVQLMSFKKQILPYHSATIIGEPTLETTLLSCVRTCVSMNSSCYTVTYNINSGSCTPGSMITYNLTGPTRSKQEVFYYTNFCNKQLGFNVYLYGTWVQCLFVSTDRTIFQTARDTCTVKGSRLYIVNSSEKLEMLRFIVRTITQSQTWIGLTDLVTEGTFVWEDGQTEANASFPVPWRPGQPDNAGDREDCGEMGTGNDFKTINDQYCGDMGYFICEIGTI